MNYTQKLENKLKSIKQTIDTLTNDLDVELPNSLLDQINEIDQLLSPENNKVVQFRKKLTALKEVSLSPEDVGMTEEKESVLNVMEFLNEIKFELSGIAVVFKYDDGGYDLAHSTLDGLDFSYMTHVLTYNFFQGYLSPGGEYD